MYFRLIVQLFEEKSWNNLSIYIKKIWSVDLWAKYNYTILDNSFGSMNQSMLELLRMQVSPL